MRAGWQLVIIAVIVTAVVVAAWRLDRTRSVAMPPIGVFDWSDVWFLAIIVVVFPVVQYVAPLRVAEVVTTLLIVAALADLLRAAVPRRPALRRVVTGAAALMSVAVSIHEFSVVSRSLIGDLLLIPVVGIAALAWSQTGMRVSHLIVIVGYLTAFDIAATPLAHVMGPLLRRLSEQQPQLIFTVPGAHDVAYLGIGDVLVTVVVPLVVRRRYGDVAGRVAAALCVVAYVAGLSVAALHPGVTVPLMVTLGPATLAAIGYGEQRSHRRRRALGRLSTAGRGKGSPTRPVSSGSMQP